MMTQPSQPAPAPGAGDAGRSLEAVRRVLELNGHQPSRLIPILQALQDEYRYLPQDVLRYVATELNVPPARVFGVATFYAHFALEAKGKHVVRLCDGTACHVKQSIPILEAMASGCIFRLAFRCFTTKPLRSLVLS